MRNLELFFKKSFKYKAKNGYNLHLEHFEKMIFLFNNSWKNVASSNFIIAILIFNVYLCSFF